VAPAKLLAYGGAGLCAFLSIAGAFTAGTTAISSLEASFFAVLEDYQDNDAWNIIDDKELGPQFGNFISVYAIDTAILMLAVFWHVFYLIGMGLAGAFFLLTYISGQETSNSSYGATDIDVNKGFQAFAFGALMGTVNYLGGIALSYNKTYMLNMLAFYDKTKTSTTTETTTTVDPSGSSTFAK